MCLFVVLVFWFFVVSVTQMAVFRVSCCLEYILYVAVSLLGLSSYTASSAKYSYRCSEDMEVATTIRNVSAFFTGRHGVFIPQYLNLQAIKNTLNRSPTSCNSMQSDLFHCKVTLRVSGITASIIRSAKNCNRSLRYRS